MEFVNSYVSFLKRHLVCFAVVLEEMLPVRFLGDRFGGFAGFRFVLTAQAVVSQLRIRDTIGHIVKIRVIAVHHHFAELIFLLRSPYAETG